MNNDTAFVRGQKVLGPAGEGFIVEVTGDKATVQLANGDKQEVPLTELEDDSDAG